MSKPLQWIIGVGVILIVTAVVFSTLWPLFAARTGWTGPSMMGPGHMGGGGMMGGWGMPFFGMGKLLSPLLIVGLVVIGAIWLVRSLGTSGARQLPSASPSQACANCGGQLQPGWKACPYCGEKV